MDRFEEARLKGLAALQERPGIGTLRERSLHAVLKYWIDPDESHHEVTLPCRLVADVYDGDQITEIQTRNFSKLRPKLARMLPDYPVTVVYPIPRVKRLVWMEPETGEMSQPRKSPKTGTAWDAFPELFYIRDYLRDPRLTVRLVYLDMDEYKLLNGWSRNRKKGACRVERIPTALAGEEKLSTAADFAALLPPCLPEPFTTTDLAKALRIRRERAGKIIYILYEIEAIRRIGKLGNAFLYQSPWKTESKIDGE